MAAVLRMKAAIAALVVVVVTSPAAGAATLTVRISGAKADAGSFHVAVCDKAHFRGRCALTAVVPARAAGVPVVFEAVAAGRYAAKVFYDVNGDGKVDTNAFGLPREPYAFTGARSKIPDFEKAAFEVGRGPRVVDVILD